jgi:hypothetical protein
MSESGPLWDITPHRTGRLARITRHWRMGLLLLIALAAVAAIVVPLLITGHRFERRLTAVNPLEQLSKEAQPASADVFDSGWKNDGKTGFAYGISHDAPSAVLAVVAPAPWQPGPPTPESPDMRLWRTGHLVLTVQADPCLRLERCQPGDTLVYTEVLDVS